MYKYLIKPLLFLLPPESAHYFTFFLLKVACKIPFGKSLLSKLFSFHHPSLKKKILGIDFPNPIGLAAGLDKDARWINELSSLGFGFIEIGTITPLAQPGNEKPRLFRLKKDNALINRMGFNNHGVQKAADRLAIKPEKIVVGGNIGKNKVTPNEDALNDYIKCLDSLYGLVDYFVVNVSSPNTPGLRELQEKEPLQKLLGGLKEHMNTKPKYYPILLKIAPDLTEGQLDDIVDIVQEQEIDGIIATNTTIERKGLATDEEIVEKIGSGGLSGKPLGSKSNELIKVLRQKLGADYPIIGTGGVFSAEDAMEKLNAGADLVQVYTGLIYEGPGLVGKINKSLINFNQNNFG